MLVWSDTFSVVVNTWPTLESFISGWTLVTYILLISARYNTVTLAVLCLKSMGEFSCMLFYLIFSRPVQWKSEIYSYGGFTKYSGPFSFCPLYCVTDLISKWIKWTFLAINLYITHNDKMKMFIEICTNVLKLRSLIKFLIKIITRPFIQFLCISRFGSSIAHLDVGVTPINPGSVRLDVEVICTVIFTSLWGSSLVQWRTVCDLPQRHFECF